MLKSIMPVIILNLVNLFETQGTIQFFALLFVVGHCYPIYNKFKGGKGVATGIGPLVILFFPSSIVALIVFILAILFIPWGADVRLPATLSYVEQHYYAPGQAQVNAIKVKRGQSVAQGDVLLSLHSGGIQYEMIKARQQLRKIKSILSSHVYDKKMREDKSVLLQQLKQKQLLMLQVLLF